MSLLLVDSLELAIAVCCRTAVVDLTVGAWECLGTWTGDVLCGMRTVDRDSYSSLLFV
jgi:hypothetical protein